MVVKAFCFMAPDALTHQPHLEEASWIFHFSFDCCSSASGSSIKNRETSHNIKKPGLTALANCQSDHGWKEPLYCFMLRFSKHLWTQHCSYSNERQSFFRCFLFVTCVHATALQNDVFKFAVWPTNITMALINKLSHWSRRPRSKIQGVLEMGKNLDPNTFSVSIPGSFQ